MSSVSWGVDTCAFLASRRVTWTPVSRDSPSWVRSYRDRLAGGALCHTAEFVGRETAQHADNAVVTTDGMEAERKACDPESGCGKPAAPQITDQHGVPGDAIQLGDRSPQCIRRKVVQKLRRDNEIRAGS